MPGDLPAVLCLVVGGLFSLAEGSLRGLSGKRLEGLMREVREGKRIKTLLYRRGEITFSARLIAFAGLFGWTVFLLAGHLMQKDGAAASILSVIEIFAAAAAIAAIVGRIIPMRLGRRLSRRSPKFLTFWLHALGVPLRPLIWLVRGGYGIADRIFGPTWEESEEERITQDVMSAVEEGKRKDIIEEEQKEMIQSILEMEDSDVSEIMTPRIDMVCIAADTTIYEAIRFCASNPQSRIPAFHETRDNIVGILYVKDLLRHLNGKNAESGSIRPILRDPLLVPETKSIRDLLREFLAKKIHLAVVLDEYGGTAGIVTLEDVLEEIVGEIRDEYDTQEEPLIKEISEGVIEAEASAHIDEINEVMRISLPESPDYETIGGFIFDFLGRVPKQKEKIDCENVEISILRSDKRRIYHVRIAVKS